jgi:hypothetical protein
VFSGAWDAAWMLPTLWLAPLVWLLSRGRDDPSVGPLDSLYFVLTAGFWIAHRLGSAWLAYGTTAFAPLRRAEPTRFFVVPALLALACFALLLPADDALPWTRAERAIGLAIADYALVTYHFASQHFGVLSLYRVRAGRSGARGVRALDRAYALIVGGALVVLAEVMAGTVFYIDVWVDPWLDPAAVLAAADTISTAATTFVVLSTLAMLAAEVRAERPSLPRALYVVGLALMVIAAFHVRTPFVFVVLWTAQHWIVATGLTTLVAQGEPEPQGGALRRVLHAVNRRPWALLLVLAALSVLMLPLMEVEAVGDGGTFYGDRIFGAFAEALRTSAWVPALVALGFTLGFLHYWLDRAVYRFSDAAVRDAARGLLAAPAPR